MYSSLLIWLQAALSAIPMRQENLFVKRTPSHRRQRTVVWDRGRGTKKSHAHTDQTHTRVHTCSCTFGGMCRCERAYSRKVIWRRDLLVGKRLYGETNFQISATGQLLPNVMRSVLVHSASDAAVLGQTRDSRDEESGET